MILLLIGIIAGGYGVIVGAGGGFIFVPALLLLFNVEPIIAAGSGILIVFVNSISGTFGYIKQQRIDYRTGILLSIGALPGSLLGVWLLQTYTSDYFYSIFASLLVLLGIFLLVKNISWRKEKIVNTNESGLNPKNIKEYHISIQLLLPLGLVMGVLSSYLGIGGGWLLVPILIYIFKYPTHIATATSIFSLFIYSSYGVISQLIYNNIDFEIVLWGSIGIIIGSQIGVKVSRHLPGKLIMQMLSVVLIGVGFRMYFA